MFEVDNLEYNNRMGVMYGIDYEKVELNLVSAIRETETTALRKVFKTEVEMLHALIDLKQRHGIENIKTFTFKIKPEEYEVEI